MKNKILNKIRNLSLSKKFASIILIVIILIVPFSIVGLILNVHSSNSLLYQSLAGSLNYSAKDISTKLATVESMTNMIVSNYDIRKNLITLNDETNTIKIKNAINSLESQLVDYQQTYKNNNISYINLYTAGKVISSYSPGAVNTAEEVHQIIKDETKKNSGYPIWDTDYCNDDGLFLGRESRQVTSRSIRTLGTIVVCIDLQKLISTSTNSVLYTDDIQYILSQDQNMFYHTTAINDNEAIQITQKIKSDYELISINNKSFFAVKGEIDNNDWNYVCLIPYDKIAYTINMTETVAFVLILLSVCIAIFLSRLLILSTIKEFSSLVAKMRAFAKDDSIIPVSEIDYKSRTDEIGILHAQFDRMVLKIQQLIQKNYVNEILAKDAQLKALENQINPHFLYNTLESVNWRAKAIGAKDISAMIEALGKLLRETLSAKEKTFTLEHELSIVKSYITIQQIRFSDRLCYEDCVPVELLNVMLPHLSIQPLVENAIYYALEEVIEPCSIRITGFKDHSGDIIIEILNNGSQFEDNLLEKLEQGAVMPHGFGIGMLNIHKRLQIIYGSSYGLKLYNLDDNHAVVQIIVPGGQNA